MEQAPKPAEAPKPKGKGMWIAAALIIVVIVVAAGVYYAFYGNQAPKYAVSITDPGGCSGGASGCRFDPASITVPSGNEVVWTNRGSDSHTVHSCTSANSSAQSTAACPNGLNQGAAATKDFSSSILANGNTFRVTFSTAGNYTYFCNLHLWMHGTILVT